MIANRPASGIAAIVLAAGMSRRMGSPKQLLRWRDKTLLEHTLENLRASNVCEIVLVLGAAADDIRRQISTDAISVVVNPEYQQGMGTSLRAGAAALSPGARAAFVVLADQPFVRPETLNHMIARYEESSPQVLIPRYCGFRGNPVLLDRSLFPELMTLAGDVGCRAIFGQHTQGIHKIEVNDPGILVDIDSAEDWKVLSSAADPLLRFQGFQDLEARHAAPTGAPELVIVSRDPIARALAEFGRLLGFFITLADPLLSLEDFPQADRILHRLDFSLLPGAEHHVVIASRGQFDEDALEEALRSGANYIGLLANRKRADELFKSLGEKGMSEERLSRVHAPIGVNIGAETAEELALSIMAEIIAVRRKTSEKKD